MRIIVFDSGIGGLTVLREARMLMPDCNFIYVADDAAFPYGDWEEPQLLDRMVRLFGQLISKHEPEMVIIACNTASTLAIEKLREVYPNTIFVGTVPAIKPAAERTSTGVVSVLATPGTVKRQYTRDLISDYASKCHVKLVGSVELAKLSDTYMRSGFVDEEAVAKEITPCFYEKDGKRTDIIVLACTHYPFLVNRMRKMAPWPVDWIDTSEAIARRALSLVDKKPVSEEIEQDFAIFTSNDIDGLTRKLLNGFGLSVVSA